MFRTTPKTALMQHGFEQHQIKTEFKGSTQYLSLEEVNKHGVSKEVKYAILTGNQTNWFVPKVSVGSIISSREIIIYDPRSPILKAKYQELVKKVKELKDDAAKINLAMDAVREIFTDPDDSKVDKLFAAWRGQRCQGAPVIKLDEFMERKIGICRHYTLVMGFFLASLIADNILPPGKVYHQRGEVISNPGGEGAGHSWIMYQPRKWCAKNAYLVDPTIDVKRKVHTLTKPSFELDVYFESLTLCREKYIIPSYSSFKDDTEARIRFMTKLLNEDILRRRRILNYQHLWGASPALLNALTADTARGREYKKHPQYAALFNDLLRVRNTESLHKLSCDKITDPNDQQQFILGLLLIDDASKRESILNRQSQNALIEIQNALNAEEDFYDMFPHYNILFTEVGLLEVKKSCEARQEVKQAQLSTRTSSADIATILADADELMKLCQEPADAGQLTIDTDDDQLTINTIRFVDSSVPELFLDPTALATPTPLPILAPTARFHKQKTLLPGSSVEPSPKHNPLSPVQS